MKAAAGERAPTGCSSGEEHLLALAQLPVLLVVQSAVLEQAVLGGLGAGAKVPRHQVAHADLRQPRAGLELLHVLRVSLRAPNAGSAVGAPLRRVPAWNARNVPCMPLRVQTLADCRLGPMYQQHALREQGGFVKRQMLFARAQTLAVLNGLTIDT